MRTITKTDVLETLHAVVTEHSGNTKRECFYINRDSNNNPVPWCIAGCALVRWGAPLAALERAEGWDIDDMARRGWNTFFNGDLVLTQAATSILYSAQRVQDRNGTWAEAVTAALETAKMWKDEE